jgi:5-methylcytosine-specific restriction endonuclease McrA
VTTWPLRDWNDRQTPRAAHRPKIRPLVRRSVYERDGWTCQECGTSFADAIPPRIHHAPYLPEVGYLQIDHIVPVARGGAVRDVDNLRALCERCNMRKGARV